MWIRNASDCQLTDGEIYHYWFEVEDTNPERILGVRIQITDPTAFVVDWRLRGLQPPSLEYGDDSRAAATVIKFSNGNLTVADPGGECAAPSADISPASSRPSNNRLVIYELPTAWTRLRDDGGKETGVGSFRDVTALIDPSAEGANFSDLGVVQPGRSYFAELGVNALELLPPADSFYDRTWGYGTTNYLAPDYELGFPQGNASPTPTHDLDELVTACHARGIRFFVDMVMGFAKLNAYLAANCSEFFILNPSQELSSPDAYTSRGRDPNNFDDLRHDWGGSLFRYSRMVNGYEPITGAKTDFCPARQLMKLAMLRWMRDFRVDGLRLDSIETVSNWDFIQEFKDLARTTWVESCQAQGVSAATAEERFLVVGEELWEPLDLLRQKRLDGLWHQKFKDFIRAALLGQNHESEPSFEWTVRRAIDSRLWGYTDMTQAVIYLTSHDVEGGDHNGWGNARIYNFFKSAGVYPAEARIKLGFACLLTAVGVPMILAGDEFADEHDRFGSDGHISESGGKQVDPVNYSRLSDSWRAGIKEYVSRLIHLRTTYDALAVNDTEFIHVDFNDNKRVLVWRRGRLGSDKQVVVVANFSDYCTEDPFSSHAEYVVPNWPATPTGKYWREVPQERDIAPDKIGREAIFPWEAKVYALF